MFTDDDVCVTVNVRENFYFEKFITYFDIFYLLKKLLTGIL